MNLFDYYKQIMQNRINENNKKRLLNLLNKEPTLICSNCTGGFIYHWLGLEFRSPFINLFMTPEDFITMLSDFDNFMSAKIIQQKVSTKCYPVGIGIVKKCAVREYPKS